MRKAIPFIVGGAVLLLLAIMVSSNATRPARRFDERITLRQSDKIPYGSRVARELLPSLFHSASVKNENAAPGKWDSVTQTSYKQAVILVADYLDADKEELQRLSDFVAKGNYVFITSRAASDDVDAFFGVSFNGDFGSNEFGGIADSLRLRLQMPAFEDTTLYVYPGRRYDGLLRISDSTRTEVLGINEKGYANFVRLNKGAGSFFLHSAPLAFGNYFILHKGNASYYEEALSVLPKDVNTVVWNEYYLQKPESKKGPNWLGTLFSYPPFKWGLLIGFFTLALYLLLGMRRRQRMIPSHQKPRNESLDFVKTLGRLYYDRRDHQNLAAKMSAYFLEHVRSRYKLPTHTLDEDFVRALQLKSGYPVGETKKIVDTILYIGSVSFMPEAELAQFYRRLEAFYQNT